MSLFNISEEALIDAGFDKIDESTYVLGSLFIDTGWIGEIQIITPEENIFIKG